MKKIKIVDGEHRIRHNTETILEAVQENLVPSRTEIFPASKRRYRIAGEGGFFRKAFKFF